MGPDALLGLKDSPCDVFVSYISVVQYKIVLKPNYSRILKFVTFNFAVQNLRLFSLNFFASFTMKHDYF